LSINQIKKLILPVDITHVMSTVHSTTEVDMNDNGNNADNAGDNPPISAQEARNAQEISK
jgi:hypothetical protein